MKKERNITINLNDEDCISILDLCIQHNISLPLLLENFIADLTGGSSSNGSDERDLASEWFDRCWFGMFPDKSFLSSLGSNDAVTDVLCLLEDVNEYQMNLDNAEKDLFGFDQMKSELVYSKGTPIPTTYEKMKNDFISVFKEELEYSKEQFLVYWNDYLNNCKNESVQTFEKAISDLIQYQKEREKLIDSSFESVELNIDDLKRNFSGL